jgi:iron complex outermembrane receptor protein
MALEMNNFVGDGNGYLGNPDLRSEMAHTVSATADLHSADRSWEMKATPYFTYVNDYIDTVRLPNSISMMGVNDFNATLTNKFVRLKYMNQSARIFGMDISGHMPLAATAAGELGLKGLVSYTNGLNCDTGDALYNIMPLNGKAALTHRLSGWDNALEVVGALGKRDISEARNEIKTAGYSLVHYRTSYTWKNVRIDLGVENMFDKKYYLPLGGAYTGQGATMSFNREVGTIGTNGGTASMWGTAVPGMGRSFYAGLTLKF